MKKAPPNLQEIVRFYQNGQYEKVVTVLSPLLKKTTQNGKLWILLSAALQNIPGKLKEALIAIKKAIELMPDDHTLYNNLGIIYQELDCYNDAIHAFSAALKLCPGYANTWISLGNAQQKMGDLSSAEISLKKAIALDPDSAQAYYNLGLCYEKKDQINLAESCYKKSLQLNPGLIEPINNLASMYLGAERTDEAQPLVERMLELKPDFPQAWFNLGNIYLNKNQFDQAEKNYLHAFSLTKNLPADMVTALLFSMSHNMAHSPEEQFERHCFFGKMTEEKISHRYQHISRQRVGHKIHIGFVSGDFYSHAAMNFLEPVLKYLKEDQNLVLTAYMTGFKKDERTQRLKEYFFAFHDCGAMANGILAEKIFQDQVDILIDLSGHTAFSRYELFAMRPAPIQASWLGYPGTSGLHSIDYYIGSYDFLPEGQFDKLFTEKLVRLPCSSPFMPSLSAPEVNELPSLHQTGFRFASFNRPNKLSPYIIHLWSQLMHQVEGATLLLGHMPSKGIPEWLLQEFNKNGVASDKLTYLPKTYLHEYFTAHHKVDLCLDTYPYGGGTTSMYALWMGVPTLTLAGEYIPSRHGATIMGLFNLPEFVATSSTDFIEKGLYWACHKKELNLLRTEIRSRWECNPLVHPKTVAHYLSKAFSIMWNNYQNQQPPAAISISK